MLKLLFLKCLISVAGSLGREMNECDFDRAENRHLTEAERLQAEANDVGRNIDMIQRRIKELREQLKKDPPKTSFEFIEK